MRYVVLIALCIYHLSFTLVFAQFSNPTVNNITLSSNPAYPSPEESVTVSLDDYATNIGGGRITWTIDGKELADNTNQRSYTFTTGAANVPTTIGVVVTLSDGQSFATQKIITPNYLDIIIEPETYTPSFYQGRAEPVFGSINRVIGILHNQNGPVDSQNYTYTWSVNNTVIGGGSIRGGNSTAYTVPHGSTHTLSLEIKDVSGTVVAKRNIAVRTSDIEVKFHELSPLYGLSSKPLTSPFVLKNSNLKIKAVPYNLDLRAVTGNSLFYEWSINGQKTIVTGNPFELAVNRTGFGTADVKFKLRNLDALLQGDEAHLMLQF